jgi:hypothetical protein
MRRASTRRRTPPRRAAQARVPCAGGRYWGGCRCSDGSMTAGRQLTLGREETQRHRLTARPAPGAGDKDGVRCPRQHRDITTLLVTQWRLLQHRRRAATETVPQAGSHDRNRQSRRTHRQPIATAVTVTSPAPREAATPWSAPGRTPSHPRRRGRRHRATVALRPHVHRMAADSTPLRWTGGLIAAIVTQF